MKNLFTVDYEDWHQGVGYPLSEWKNYENRLKIGHDALLNLLSKKNVKATFFLLGKTIEDNPELIQEIIDEGHEIGSHTYSHPYIYNITREEFEKDMQKSLELIKPFNIQYKGFRAPFFSVDHRSIWTLDVLKNLNFEYDASIFPGDSKRTGIVGFPKKIHTLENGLLELPMTLYSFFKQDFATGGGYFRFTPYKLFKKRFEAITKEQTGIFYIHPWELDPKQPKLKGLSKRINFTHYVNLSSTEKKIERLLSDFEFTSIQDYLNQRNEQQ